MTIFSPAQEAEIFAAAKAAAKLAAVEEARSQIRERGEWLSPAEVCGMLDIGKNTLDALPIKRTVIVPKKVVRYQLSDVLNFLKSVRE
jgi:hypothetical protein